MDDREIDRVTSLEERHWWYVARRNLLREHFRDLPTGLGVDVGAAGGGNSLVLQELGWKMVALEYSVAGAQVALGRGLASVRADALRLPLGTEKADAALVMDVLEHLDDDAAAVRELARILVPGGRAFITVPADPGLWSAHDVALEHRRRYTRESLSLLLSRNGLEIQHMWSWNVVLRPVVMVRRKVTTRSPAAGSEMAPVSPLINRALGGLLSMEARCPRLRDLPGVSLVVIATPAA